MIIHSLILTSILFHSANSWGWLSKPVQSKPSVIKVAKEPILIVNEPRHSSRVHLIGVTHGSPVSAQLVQNAIQNVKPSVVVLELCEERYVSICVESEIKPNVDDKINNLYNEILAKESKEELLKRLENPTMSFALNYLKFLRAQGIVVGSFVSMGIIAGFLQKLFQTNSLGDEFTTAMKESAKFNIPIRLGDALQSETLTSIRKALDWEVFYPTSIFQGAKQLGFSALGVYSSAVDLTTSLREEERKILLSAEELKKVPWINLGQVYLDNKRMIKTMLPILMIASFTTLLSMIGVDFSSATSIQETQQHTDQTLSVEYLQQIIMNTNMNNLWASWKEVADVVQQSVWSLLITPFPIELQEAIENALNILGILLIIRLSKVIGTNRDKFIAKKIQEVCAEFPQSDIVVVIGMLHCNGVANWLASGRDPYSETS